VKGRAGGIKRMSLKHQKEAAKLPVRFKQKDRILRL